MTRSSFKKLTAIALRDDATGHVFYEFCLPGVDGAVDRVVTPNGSSLSAKAAAIRSVNAAFPVRGGSNLIEAAQLQAGPPIPQTARTGWKACSDRLAAFALPSGIIEMAPTGYRWAGKVPDALAGIGRSKGNGAQFAAGLASLSRASNFIAFAVMATLAGPLRRFAELAESPVFAFHGDSSVGKTTLLRIAAAVQGSPDAMCSWELTPRALEEAGSVCNDLALLLNAAERCPKPRLADMLQKVVHSIPDGKSAGRSAGVQDRFADLAWSGVTLSTANQSGREMAARLQWSWDSQEEARFLDIPVPSADLGGIFDRPSKRPPAEEHVSVVR